MSICCFAKSTYLIYNHKKRLLKAAFLRKKPTEAQKFLGVRFLNPIQFVF